MSSRQPLRAPACSKARRAANNNFSKQMKTLDNKLTKLWRDYGTEIYFLAYRNGRFYLFSSKDESSWPPEPKSLVSPPRSTFIKLISFKDQVYPPPVKKGPLR